MNVEVVKMFNIQREETVATYVLYVPGAGTGKTLLATLTEREANDLISSLGIAIADREVVA